MILRTLSKAPAPWFFGCLAAWLQLAVPTVAALQVEPGDPGPSEAHSAPGPLEATLHVALLDNGGFDQLLTPDLDPDEIAPIAWWQSKGGVGQLTEEYGERWLRTRGDEWARQPVAAYAPLMDGLQVRGRMRGKGVLSILDGSGGVARFPLAAPEGEEIEFSIDGRELAARLGRPAMPRLLLELRSAGENESALWRALEVRVELPSPSREALRAEIIEQLVWIYDIWLERALDREGPRSNALVCHFHDVVTGQRLRTFPGSAHPLYEQILKALQEVSDPDWEAALEQHVEDFLAIGLQPATGIPCLWDPVADKPEDIRSIQIAIAFGFLIDVAQRGPERLRQPALEAAQRVGEHVLEQGVLPDGNVAAVYRPRDGKPHGNLPPLRHLDVPAQLARLAALTGDGRLLDAARESVLTLEYTHVWTGSWRAIDPGFDDLFGHYGARASTMWKAHPTEQTFANLALDGYRFFAPIWDEALRLGGNVAADQVRCWKVFIELAALEPTIAQNVDRLIDSAVRVHFKGEQYGNGAWGDVTIFHFNPKSNLQVGELSGAPSYLLTGLALAHDLDTGLTPTELRAMFTAVMRSSINAYRRPYGFLGSRAERSENNLAGGSLRFASGLLEMLQRL